MGGFTKKQAEIVAAVGQIAISYAGGLHEIIHHQGTRLAALEVLLQANGVVTRVALEAAIKEEEARMMVETALSPKLQTLQDELLRLLGGEGQEEG